VREQVRYAAFFKFLLPLEGQRPGSLPAAFMIDRCAVSRPRAN